jgi:hypothetical protein
MAVTTWKTLGSHQNAELIHGVTVDKIFSSSFDLIFISSSPDVFVFICSQTQLHGLTHQLLPCSQTPRFPSCNVLRGHSKAPLLDGAVPPRRRRFASAARSHSSTTAMQSTSSLDKAATTRRLGANLRSSSSRTAPSPRSSSQCGISRALFAESIAALGAIGLALAAVLGEREYPRRSPRMIRGSSSRCSADSLRRWRSCGAQTKTPRRPVDHPRPLRPNEFFSFDVIPQRK